MKILEINITVFEASEEAERPLPCPADWQVASSREGADVHTIAVPWLRWAREFWIMEKTTETTMMGLYRVWDLGFGI